MPQRLVRRGAWIVFWSLGFCWVSAIQAAEPADAVPDSASVVFRWKTPQTTLAKFADYVDVVQPGFGAIVKSSLHSVGLLIANPELAGVETDKDWWVIVFAESGEIPTVVFMIPVTDAKSAEDALPDDVEFQVTDDLAIYSFDEDAFNLVRDRLNGKGTSLWSKVDESSKKLFEASDLSTLINIRQLAEAFDSELEQAEPKFNELTDQVIAALPENQRAQLEMAFDVYRTIGKGLLQAVKDSPTAVSGLTISKDAIRIEKRMQVDSGTPTAEFLGKQATSDLSLMNRLPANKSIYFGLKADTASMVEWSMNMTKALLENSSDQQKVDFDAAIKQMRDLKYGDMAGYFDIDLKSQGAMRQGSVAEITPTNQLRDISRAMIKAMGTIELPGFTQTSTLEPAAEKIGGTEVDRITIVQEVDSKADPLGMQKKLRDVLFGKAGMQQRVMYQPKRVLQTLGGGTDEMQTLSNALGSSTAKDSAMIATARKRFSEKTNVILLADVAMLIANGTKIAIQEKSIKLKPEAVDDLKLQPSFIGLSITCEPSAVRSQFEIPSTQAQGIAKSISLIVGGLR